MSCCTGVEQAALKSAQQARNPSPTFLKISCM
jgi:hypothetical protein